MQYEEQVVVDEKVKKRIYYFVNPLRYKLTR